MWLLHPACLAELLPLVPQPVELLGAEHSMVLLAGRGVDDHLDRKIEKWRGRQKSN